MSRNPELWQDALLLSPLGGVVLATAFGGLYAYQHDVPLTEVIAFAALPATLVILLGSSPMSRVLKAAFEKTA